MTNVTATEEGSDADHAAAERAVGTFGAAVEDFIDSRLDRDEIDDEAASVVLRSVADHLEMRGEER